MPKLPQTVFVGPADYLIRHEKKYPMLGETMPDDTEIVIRKAQSFCSKQNTFLHEILHAIVWESGYRQVAGLNGAQEETMVRVLTPWILAVLQDNPDVLAFLLSKGAGE
jgi:hypothetical protein